MVRTLAAAAVLSASCLATTASAASFGWSYSFSNGSVLSGFLEGTLGGDLDTISVDAIDGVSLDGTAIGTPLSVISVTESLGGPAAPALVSLSGATMDLCADTVGDCTGAGLLFLTGVASTAFTTLPDGAGFSGVDVPFNAQSWEISEVPLPATGWLLIAAVGALAARGARKKATA